MSICRKCGNVLPQNAAVCPYCGTPAALQQPPCPNPQRPAPQAPGCPPQASYPVQQPPYTAPQPPVPQGACPPPPCSAVYPPLTPAEPDGGLSTAQYFWMLVLFALPIIGLVFMFYWAFGKDAAPARRRLSRAFLIKTAVTLGIAVVTIGLWAALFFSVFRTLAGEPSLRSSLGSYTAAQPAQSISLMHSAAM
jgi:hypothetical protein